MKFLAVISLFVLTNGFNPLVAGPQLTENQHRPKGTRFPASRMTPQGEVFLSWPFPVREWFVESAFAGYKAGYDEGCHDGANHAALGRTTQVNGCRNRNRLDNKAILYAQKMTDFYNNYPSDRDLPLNYLIRMLLDPKSKTLEEIHQWVSSIPQ